MGLFLTSLLLGAMTLLDVPQLIKEQQWKELAAYTFLWVIAAALSILLTLHIPLPVIDSYIAMATHWFLSLFTGGS